LLNCRLYQFTSEMKVLLLVVLICVVACTTADKDSGNGHLGEYHGWFTKKNDKDNYRTTPRSDDNGDNDGKGDDDDHEYKKTTKKHYTKPYDNDHDHDDDDDNNCGDRDHKIDYKESESKDGHYERGDDDDKLHVVRRFDDRFDSVDVCGNLQKVTVIFTEEEENVEITGPKKFIKQIQTYIVHGKLHIFPVDLKSKQTKQISIIVHIHSESRRSTVSAGTNSVVTVDASAKICKLYLLQLIVLAGGQINANVAVQQLNSTIATVGYLTLRGSAEYAGIEIRGSGKVDAMGLKTRSTYINVYGSADLSIFATKLIYGLVNGGCTISYRSPPRPDIDIKTIKGGFTTIFEKKEHHHHEHDDDYGKHDDDKHDDDKHDNDKHDYGKHDDDKYDDDKHDNDKHDYGKHDDDKHDDDKHDNDKHDYGKHDDDKKGYVKPDDDKR
jgi:hypothetical protein